MILIRAFEEEIMELVRQEKALGMQILAIGQEGCAAGTMAALETDDVVVTNHRSHGHLLARGADPAALMAEILGRTAGVNRGKSGTLHLAVPEVNALMTSTVVGAAPPLGVGAAFAQHYQATGGLTMVFFGDGAAAEGSVHEAMNLAAVWKLPVLFVCENNCWAGAQALEVHCSLGAIADRAASYDMPGAVVDGNDVDEVLAVTRDLAGPVRAQEGPALLEARTYRMRGHGEHDPQHYVDKAELEAWSRRDPIELYRIKLLARGDLDEAELKNMREQARAEVARAREFALCAPMPAPEQALEHLWASNPAGRGPREHET
jgi:pyruvate dehydrogenase E1 component alpha subunit